MYTKTKKTVFSEDMIYEPPQKKQKAAYDNVSKTSVFDANLNMKVGPSYDVSTMFFIAYALSTRTVNVFFASLPCQCY